MGDDAIELPADGVIETEAEIRTPDGLADAVLFHPAGKGPWPAVLFWPDIFGGLRPAMRDMARRLAGQGHTVLLVNVFYRDTRSTQPDADQRRTFRLTLTPDAIERDAAAFMAFLDAQPQTDLGRKVGTQGYCLGGPYAFRTAAAAPSRVGAVASFHAVGLFTDSPDSPHRLLAAMKGAELLCCVARDDDRKEPGAREALQAACTAQGVRASVELYPADHGWCVPDKGAYDEAAAERAWAELTALYRRAL